MKQKDLKEATFDMVEDVRLFKMLHDWHKPTIEIYDGYIECSFRIRQTLRSIPDSTADEWRMYADQGDIVLVFTYYYLTEDK